MRRKILSIVIPVYNVEKYLEECLLSVINSVSQANQEQIEIIIIDDKSTDGSCVIAQKYKEAFPDLINFVLHDVNLGLGGARNTGLAQATGDFVTFIDSDDWYYEGAVDTIISQLLTLSVNDILIFGFTAINRNEIVWKYIPEKRQRMDSSRALLLFALDKITPSVWNKVFPLRIAKEIKFRQHVYYEDLEFTARALEKCKAVAFFEKPMIYYRLEGVSITRQTTKQKHVQDLSRALRAINSEIRNPEITSNLFFDRWSYLLRIWQLTDEIVLSSFKEILNLLHASRPKIYSSEKYSAFIERLKYVYLLYQHVNEIEELYHRIIGCLELHNNEEEVPFFSIVIPVFNASKYIDKTIDQFARQKVTDFELIFVNDQSSDDSAGKIIASTKRYDFIKYFETPESSGAGVARNIGLSKSRGRYIMFNDADDWFDENGLEELKRHIEKNDFPDLVIFSFSVFDEHGKFLWANTRIENLDENKITSGSSVFAEICASTINPSPWNKVFRRTIWTDNSIEFPPEIHHQDLASIPFACFKAKTVTILKKRLYNYYTNLLGVTRTATDKHVYSPYKAIERLFAFFKRESKDVFETWQVPLLRLAFETFNYNFNARKDLFADRQIEGYIGHFNTFCLLYKIEAVYLLNSDAGFKLVKSLISEKTKRGIKKNIVCFTAPESFEKLAEHYAIMENQFFMLLK